MNPIRTALTSAITLGLIAAMPASAQEGVSFETTELSPGLYMLIGQGGFTGGNLAVSTGKDGTVLIDDSMAPIEATMMAAIAEITDDDVDYVINTHYHGDHTGGNAHLGRDGAVIVAHDNIRKRLVNPAEGTPATPEEGLPVITFSKQMTFHLNDNPAHIIHLHHAHTDGDAIIHFPEANVIHTGDTVFNGLFPYIDLDGGGSVDGFIAAQHKILSLCNEDTKIIAGHGPMANCADVQAAVAMLEDSRARIMSAMEDGLSEDETWEANPLADYHDDWNWGFITTERMTRQLYKGLSKEG